MLLTLTVAAMFAPLANSDAQAQSIDECRKLYRSGLYRDAYEMAHKAVQDRAFGHDWRILLGQSMLAMGRYDDAAIKMTSLLQRYPTSVRMLMLAHDVYLMNGQTEEAKRMLSRIDQLARSFGAEFWDPDELVTLGEAALKMGAEPKLVLDVFYGTAKKRNRKSREPYLAAGELALGKQDYGLAAKQFREGLKHNGDDADLHFGLAQALYAGDRVEGVRALDAVFHLNPNHIDARLLTVDHMVDSEQYDPAIKTLEKIFDINPNHPEAWAYRAVIAHINNDAEGEKHARTRALKFWPTNPNVDYLIGRKLSQKYRFREAARYQRSALAMDPSHVPAKMQLAQDLLRLGEGELEEGWKLVDEVHTADEYNVLAYNLVTLKDQLADFTTIKTPHFFIRMDKREAEVYGDEVVELLTRAHDVLTEKYGLKITQRVIVEIYPDQRDFAIRTFGMPGGIGYLGVCFGNVITANSPASISSRQTNWKSVLWHEFCHVVTLHLTKNKMPRWLSEGISVYEELQRNPTWGQSMTPTYRSMILNGELTPVGDLSSAFLNPKSPMHVMFAYYQSNLVVEYLIDEHGIDSVKGILKDLAEGVKINDAISRHADRMDKIEVGFEAFAKRRAESLAPKLGWDKPEEGTVDPRDIESVRAWVADHPTSLWGLTALSRALMADEQWEKAVKHLKVLTRLYPDNPSDDGPWMMLAAAYRELDRAEDERAALEKLASMSASATAAYDRLMELAAAEQQWDVVKENAEKYMAVNPLIALPYERLGAASEATGDDDRAIDVYRRLLKLNPTDPAGVHYRLALLLRERDRAASKRHVLLALSEAPRFRDAHRLLLELIAPAEQKPDRDVKEKNTDKTPSPKGNTE